MSGYGCRVGRCAGASNLSLVLVDATNHTIIATIWDSPALNNASYDSFQGYSSSVTGSATGLRLRTTRLTQLALLPPLVLKLFLKLVENLVLALNLRLKMLRLTLYLSL